MQKILVLCAGNSCRSIMAEALINHFCKNNFKAVSAGRNPAGYIHQETIETLKRNGIAPGIFRSKSWDEFSGQSFALIIKVCDQAANEICPILLGSTKNCIGAFQILLKLLALVLRLKQLLIILLTC